MIRKEGREFVLFSKDGSRRLGSFKTHVQRQRLARKRFLPKSLKRSQ